MTRATLPDWTAESALLATWNQMLGGRAEQNRNPPPRGVDGLHATAFEARKEFHCSEIARILARQDPDGVAATQYRFAPLIEHERETEPGKIRRVYIPRIRDQIVIRSLYSSLGMAMRKVGLHGSLNNPQTVARQLILSRLAVHKYVARLDIRGFYDAVSHPLLLSLLADLPLDDLTQNLIEQLVVDTPHRPRRGTQADDKVRTQGLPTGTSIATLLAELYLSPVDATARALADLDYHRFVDDIIVLGTEPDALHDGTMEIADTAADLSLQLHGRKSHFASFEGGFEYLGFSYKGSEVRVAPERIKKWLGRFEAICRNTLRDHAEQAPPERLEALLTAFNREIVGAGSRHIPYYAIVDRLDVYKEVDQALRRMVAGVARRAGQAGRLESCHAWAWRYKKDPVSAAKEARLRFG